MTDRHIALGLFMVTVFPVSLMVQMAVGIQSVHMMMVGIYQSLYSINRMKERIALMENKQ